ncbi:LysR family transcriptional regulator [Hyphomonas sp.]|uniref:LysR family transcriptional regulator n=1 Tax=Hyphomonas sp. TaxID=87 RepID=UPI00391C2EF0
MNLEELNWDTLRVFRIVAELSSMSAAATRLKESPPTISRKIDELEAVLGTQLFFRTRRGVELTEEGKVVLRFAHQMAEAASTLHEKAADRGSPVEGAITFATGDGIGPYWIAPRIGEFQKENPRIQVRLIVRDELPDLQSGEADIAIQFSEPRHHDVIAHRLGVQHYIGFASPDYLARNSKPDSLFEYYKHPCLLHSSYVNQVERWAPKVAELKKMIDFAFVSNSGTALIEACAAGRGIAILPSFVAALDARIVPLDLPEIAPIQFWITYTEEFRRTRRGRLFIEWVRRLFELPEAVWFREEFVHPGDPERKVHAFPAPKR